jgi:hypothetical protein
LETGSLGDQDLLCPTGPPEQGPYTDPVSETSCLGRLMMDNVQNNYLIYDNTPSSETFRLSLEIVLSVSPSVCTKEINYHIIYEENKMENLKYTILKRQNMLAYKHSL